MTPELYESEQLTELIIQGMEDTKAKKIVILDLQDIDSAVTNYFVICHGNSKPQLEAIADSVIAKTVKGLKAKPWHKEGFENAEWILLDYVDVVVHIFREDRREFYQLEKLWADAPITRHEYKE
ncbi:MAG: ribosome silencing factor [Bacteroidales bacterium]|jgi:ribosome-associated protein|nr:ribosome silencing factor [Bacteroidales bacterium]